MCAALLRARAGSKVHLQRHLLSIDDDILQAHPAGAGDVRPRVGQGQRDIPEHDVADPGLAGIRGDLAEAAVTALNAHKASEADLFNLGLSALAHSPAVNSANQLSGLQH